VNGRFGGCATCTGACCRTYLVPVTVADVRSLVQATALYPQEFLALGDARPGVPGFLLDPTGTPQMLLLDRRQSTGACTFLIELPDGQGRCGVYPDRPLGCRTFPAVLRHGTAAVREDVLCGPSAWNVATMNLPALRHNLIAQHADWAAHERVAAAWNAGVDSPRTPAQLYRYLLDQF